MTRLETGVDELRAPSESFAGLDAIRKKLVWIAALLALLYVISGIAIVSPGEAALVFRLGALPSAAANRVHGPGLLLAWPYPIDKVVRLPVKQEQSVELVALSRLARSGLFDDRINPLENGYVLTGDQNIVTAYMTAKYRIEDPVAYVLQSESPAVIVENSVTSAATKVFAMIGINDALRIRNSSQSTTDDTGSGNLGLQILSLAQAHLDALGIGVRLQSVELKEVQPVKNIAEAFRSAQTSRVRKETMKQEALGFKSSTIPKAESDRDTMIQQAVAEATAAKAAAYAETSVFDGVMTEYRKNPSLVRTRLKREAIEEMLRKVEKRYFIPGGGTNGSTKILISKPEDDNGTN